MASRSTGGAHPSSNACFQRLAQRHHLSPALSPGKLYSNLGVVKSLPALELNVRKASSTTTQTVWTPLSVLSVLQHPSLNHPVFGSSLHVFRAVPSTLIEGSTFAHSYWIDIKCCRSSYYFVVFGTFSLIPYRNLVTLVRLTASKKSQQKTPVTMVATMTADISRSPSSEAVRRPR